MEDLILDKSVVHVRGWIDFYHTDTLNAEIHFCPNGELMIFIADKKVDDVLRAISEESDDYICDYGAAIAYLMGAGPTTHGYCWLDSNGRPTGCDGVVITDDGPEDFNSRTELLKLADKDNNYTALTLLKTFDELIEKANKLLRERSQHGTH